MCELILARSQLAITNTTGRQADMQLLAEPGQEPMTRVGGLALSQQLLMGPGGEPMASVASSWPGTIHSCCVFLARNH